jgi:hypothetical protein
MSRLLVLLAIVCALVATVIGFQWPFEGGQEDWGGWLAASLLAYFVSGEVNQ